MASSAWLRTSATTFVDTLYFRTAWGPETEEATFKDLLDGTGKSRAGYDKIQFAENRLSRIVYNTFGWTHAVSTNRTTTYDEAHSQATA